MTQCYPFVNPPLPYGYGALEPYIDETLDSVILFKSRQEKWLDKEFWGRTEDRTDFML